MSYLNSRVAHSLVGQGPLKWLSVMTCSEASWCHVQLLDKNEIKMGQYEKD